jgi:hypothetical protein
MNNLFNIFFIFYIISTNNLLSFSFTKKIYFKNLIFKNPTLNMCCDYYIIEQLKINYKNENTFSIIKLSKEGADFNKLHRYDEEEYFYNYKVLKFYDEQLISKKIPLIIFSNNIFIEECYEKDYIEKINKVIKIHNKKLEDISEISKIEFRIKNY